MKPTSTLLVVWLVAVSPTALAFAPSTPLLSGSRPPLPSSNSAYQRKQTAFRPTAAQRLTFSQVHVIYPVEASSFLTSAVEYFDGSEIVDPVVVSNVFSASLQARFVSFILGQVLAAVVFGILTSVASQQITKAGEWASESIFKNSAAPTTNKNEEFQNNNNARDHVMIRKPDFFKLLVCVAIDVIGTSSELVPVLGEVTDVVWAPIAALLLRSLYGGSNVVLVLEFAEEILPLTDILPLATICWVIDTFLPASDVAKLLQLGIYRSDYYEDAERSVESPSSSSTGQAPPPGVIDVEVRDVDQRQIRSAAAAAPQNERDTKK